MTKLTNFKEQHSYVFKITFTAKNIIPMTYQHSREIIWNALSNIPEFKDVSFQEFECSVNLTQIEVDEMATDYLNSLQDENEHPF
jgi:hypothetical protein